MSNERVYWVIDADGTTIRKTIQEGVWSGTTVTTSIDHARVREQRELHRQKGPDDGNSDAT